MDTAFTIYETTTALFTALSQLTINFVKQDLCLEIALWAYFPNETIPAYYNKLFNILPVCIHESCAIDIPLDVIKTIILYLNIGDNALKWSKCDNALYDNLLELSNYDSMVRYRDPLLQKYGKTMTVSQGHRGVRIRRNRSTIVGGSDYVIVKSSNYIVMNHRVLIHCYIKSVGDEMWIGLMEKTGYDPHRSLRRNVHAITYYNRGVLHCCGTGVSYSGGSLCGYVSSDWLTFDILLTDSVETCIMDIYRDGKLWKQCGNKMEHFITKGVMDKIVFIAEVDFTDDAIFIEQTFPSL